MIKLKSVNPLVKFFKNALPNSIDFFWLSIKLEKSALVEPTDLFEPCYDLKIRSIKERNAEKFNSNKIY